jgi:hypothetical protein
MRPVRLVLAMAAALALASGSAAAADPQIVELAPGAAGDAYFQINLRGKIYVQIAAPPSGEPCAEFWWIKWPLGTVEHLGRHCERAVFDIPGIFSLTLSSKLRAQAGPSGLKLAVSASESVAMSTSFTF